MLTNGLPSAVQLEVQMIAGDVQRLGREGVRDTSLARAEGVPARTTRPQDLMVVAVARDKRERCVQNPFKTRGKFS